MATQPGVAIAIDRIRICLAKRSFPVIALVSQFVANNDGDHPVAAKKLRFKFAADRRLGCIAWFCRVCLLGSGVCKRKSELIQ